MRAAKKGLFVLTAFLSAAALTACGKGKGESEPEWVYVPEFLSTDETLDSYDAKLLGDNIYSVAYSWDEELQTSSRIVSQYSILEGKVTESHPVVLPEDLASQNWSMGRYTFTEDGSLFAVVQIYSDNWEERNDLLVKFDAGGQCVYRQDITEQVNGSYIDMIAADAQGRVYLSCDDSLLLYDAEGKGYADLGEEIPAGSYVRGLCRGGEGEIYIDYGNYDGSGYRYCLAEIDFDNRKLGTVYENLPNHNKIAAGTEWDFYLEDGMSVYGYSKKTQEWEKLFAWLDSDVNGNYVGSFGELEDGRLVATVRDYERNDNSIVLLTRTEAAQVAKRETIVIGTMGGAYSLQSYAAAFNRSSDKYRISIKQYVDYNNYSESSWKDALTNFNNDLISSNCPDIIDLSGVNITQLAAKGLFVDLGAYLDESSTLNRSDFLESILNAYTLNGVLVSIPTSFELSTIVGSAADLGTEAGWTLNDLMEYANSHPDAELFDSMSKSYMMQILMTYNEDAFIDWSTGECYFDSDMFKSLLEFVNRFPEEADYSGDPTPLRIQNKEVLLDTVSIYQFNSVQEPIEIYEGNPVWIGFPTVDGKSSHALTTSLAYAITTKSDCKEGAWEFLEYLLNDDRNGYYDGFPTKKESLEKMIEEATRQFYVDENGDPILDEEGNPIKIESMGSYSTWSEGGVSWSFAYHVVTQEEVDIVLSLIENAKMVSYGGGSNEVISIISEEAEAFFKGQKSVDDVAGVIQSRVKMYVSTNS